MPTPRTAQHAGALAAAAALMLGSGALLLLAAPGATAQLASVVVAEDDDTGSSSDTNGADATQDTGPSNQPVDPAEPDEPAPQESAEPDEPAPQESANGAGSSAKPENTAEPTGAADTADESDATNPADPDDGLDATQDQGQDEAENGTDGDEDVAAADGEDAPGGEFSGDLNGLPFVPDAKTTLTANFALQISQAAQGPTVAAAGAGLAPDTRFEVWVFSTPQLVSTGFAGADGAFSASADLPTNLEPGAHTVVVRGTSADGLPTEAASGITIGEQGQLLSVDPNVDASALSAPTLPASPKAPPFTPVVALDTPEAVVTTAVAALALVSVAGAGLGAAAGMRLPDRIDRMAPADQEAAGLDVAVRGSQDTLDDVDVDHNRGWRTRFSAKGAAKGDASLLHRAPATAFVDEMSYVGVGLLASRSPLLARALADGAPVRAMVGSLSLLLPSAALILAVVAAILGDGIAQPPVLALLIPLIVIGVFDGLAGLLGGVAFAVAVAAQGGILDASSVRTLLGVALLVAGPGLIAGTFRDIRQPAGGGSAQTWERLTDVVVVPLVGAWTTFNIVSALPALGGSAFPLADDAQVLATVVLVSLLAKVALEYVVARWFPERLATVVPKTTTQPGSAQRVASSLLRTGVFLFVSAAFVGNVWQLWVAAALFLVPNILELLADRFPNSTRLWSLSPGSVMKLALILVCSWAISAATLMAFSDTAEFAQMAFLLLAIPGFLLSLLPLLGRHPAPGQQPWQNRPSMTWVYRGGGVLVLAVTIWLALTV